MRYLLSISIILVNLFFSVAHARVFQIQPNENSPPLTQIVPNGYAVLGYDVENVGLDPYNSAGLVDIPTGNNGITQMTNSSQCGNVNVDFDPSTNCAASFALSPGQQCTLLLCVSGANIGPEGTNVAAGPTVCANPDVPGMNCATPALVTDRINISVINPSTAPNFTVSPSPAALVPGTEITWIVTNSSSQIIYQIAPNFTGTPIGPYVVDSNTQECTQLAAGSQCNITANISASAPTLPLATVNFAGANSQIVPVQMSVSAVDEILTITGVTLSMPGLQQSIVITNNSSFSLSDFEVILPSIPGLQQITTTCSITLAAAGNCYVTLQASEASFGQGNLMVTYMIENEPGIELAHNAIIISPTNIQVNGGNDIKLALEANPQSFTIVNTGPFDLQDLQIEFTGLANVIFDPSACPVGQAFPDLNQCTIVFTVNTVTDESAVATVGAEGTNGSTNQQVSLSDLTIAVANNFNHLQYKAIEITNDTSAAVILTSPTISNSLANEVVLCTSLTPCDYNSTCSTTSPLGTNASCNWVFQSIASPTQTLGSTAGTITVEVTQIPTIWQAEFPVTQITQLYATGTFTTAGTTSVSNIAAWNGSSWVALGGTGTGLLNGTGRALEIFGGDLYVGGSFTVAGGVNANYIANWNGNVWSAVGNQLLGPAAAGVFALESNGQPIYSGNSLLYMGGSFTQIGSTASNALRLAQWNGTGLQIEPLANSTGYGVNNIVYSLLFPGSSGNSLYVGGTFTSTIAAATTVIDYISIWNTTTNAWSTFGTTFPLTQVNALNNNGTLIYAAGVNTTNRSASLSSTTPAGTWTQNTGANNTIEALIVDSNANVFAGGIFSSPTTGIAQLQAGIWAALSGNPNLGTVYSLYSFPTASPTLYAGGTFGAGSLNNIAYKAGAVWVPLGGGLTGTGSVVNALLIAPSLTIQ